MTLVMFVVKERTAGPSTARLNCLLRPEAGATNSEAPLWMTFVFSTRVVVMRAAALLEVFWDRGSGWLLGWGLG
jgi:hypothetical protein